MISSNQHYFPIRILQKDSDTVMFTQQYSLKVLSLLFLMVNINFSNADEFDCIIALDDNFNVINAFFLKNKIIFIKVLLFQTSLNWKLCSDGNAVIGRYPETFTPKNIINAAQKYRHVVDTAVKPWGERNTLRIGCSKTSNSPSKYKDSCRIGAWFCHLFK